jgi:hypothetical protein
MRRLSVLIRLFSLHGLRTNCTADNKISAVKLSNTVPILYLLNATSLAKTHALSQLDTDLSQHNVDFCLITETWFNSKMDDKELLIPGYNIFRRDRVGRRGGGICCYARNSIQCAIFSVSPVFELMWLKACFNGLIFYIACGYHPPNPQYMPESFTIQLYSDVDKIAQMNDNSVIVVAGDFNQLNLGSLESDYGLTQIVLTSTHGMNTLDKVFINRPDLFQVTVYKSLIKTKHLAVIVYGEECKPVSRNIRRTVRIYDHRSHNIDKLRYTIATFDWSTITDICDITVMYTAFLNVIHQMIESSIPCKYVRMSMHEPPFVTPLVKLLLRKRNKLRRMGKLSEANTIAEKINGLIIEDRGRRLAKLSNSSSKELWAAVKHSGGNGSATASLHPLLSDVNAVNDFFANISYTAQRHDLESSATADLSPESWRADLSILDYQIEPYLKNQKLTAPGLDGLPSWLFRSCSVELAGIVSQIISRSFNQGIIPDHWKKAVVTPVPKAAKPVDLSDYRPISVTPILSRLAEKLIVKKWLYPSIPHVMLQNQFAFKPTGSTTSALVFLTHHVTRLLETNAYVRCILIDYSKAFDLVDHNILADKLSVLSLPKPILHWIFSFLSYRKQQVKWAGVYSDFRPINRGTVQGSGIGPTLYIIMEGDSKAVSVNNIVFLYADDKTLMVPQNTDVDVSVELQAIEKRASLDRMIINMKKTKEIVFQRPNVRHCLLPDPMAGIERVTETKLLGVLFCDNLKFDVHVRKLMTLCSQRCYLLRQLKGQGLSARNLRTIFLSIIVSRILYAIPAWGGFLSAELINRIDAFFNRAKKYGYITDSLKLNMLMEAAESKLSTAISDPNHCAHQLLPEIKPINYELRDSHKLFALPQLKYNLFKRSFVMRFLFNHSY